MPRATEAAHRRERNDRAMESPALFQDSFCFFLGPPSPGGSREGPDCHFPSEIGGGWPVPARIRGVIYFEFLFCPKTQLLGGGGGGWGGGPKRGFCPPRAKSRFWRFGAVFASLPSRDPKTASPSVSITVVQTGLHPWGAGGCRLPDPPPHSGRRPPA